MFPEHRIICLARSGDWNAAALALATYSSINEINETLERLLINYLDHEAELKIKRKDLCLKESSVIVYLCAFSGIKPLDSELPIAFLYTNLSRDKSLRARINASEEFVKSGALNPNILFSNYKIKQPSTSGGVWARAKLIQELDEHYKNSELNQLILLEHLSLVVREFVKNDLITQFSQIYAEKLYQIKPKQSNLKLYEMVLALILLSDLELDDWRAVKTNNLKLNLAIYLESEDIGLINKNTNVEERLSRYFTSRQKTEFTLLDKIVMEASMGKFPIGRNSTNEILNALSQGRKGFVLVHALFLISAGKNSDLFDLQTGLASLVIAKEILILDYFKNSLDFS